MYICKFLYFSFNFHNRMARVSKGVLCFGENQTVEIIDRFYKSHGLHCSHGSRDSHGSHGSLPIVSIGSGNGYIEYYSGYRHPEQKWICCDPNPSSWTPGHVYKKPEFPTAQHLLEARPELENNCILFINWAFPNDSSYDYDAITTLKPRRILSIYEEFKGENGAAGGVEFYNFVQQCKRKKSPENLDYHFVYEASLKNMAASEKGLDPRIVWLSKQCPINDDDERSKYEVLPNQHFPRRINYFNSYEALFDNVKFAT